MILIFLSSSQRPVQNYQKRVYRSSRLDVVYKKGLLKNFAKFTGKHLCQSPFFNRVAGLPPVVASRYRIIHWMLLWFFSKFVLWTSQLTLIYLFIYLFVCLIDWLIDWLILFILFIYLFIYLFIHLFIYLFIYLLIYLFIYLFATSNMYFFVGWNSRGF